MALTRSHAGSTAYQEESLRGVGSAVPWPFGGIPRRSRWRLLAAIGALVEGTAHIPVIDQHLSEAAYIGVGFELLTVAGLVLGVLLLTADTPAVWAATLVVSVLAIAGYVLSRSVGLPQIHDDIGNWAEPLGMVALTGETIMVLTALAHLGGRSRR